MKTFPPSDEAVSACVWVSDGKSFITGSYSKKNSLQSWNLNGEKICDWNTSHVVMDLCGNGCRLVAIDAYYTVYVYSMETRQLEFQLELEARAVSISISQDEQSFLVNTKIGELLLVDIASQNVILKYSGHAGGDFVIRNAYGGGHDELILSGSEGNRLPFTSLPRDQS